MRLKHLLWWPALALMLGSGMPTVAQVTPVFQTRSQEWSGTLTSSTAHADCRIESDGSRNCKIFIDATGLSPNASYSVWINPDHGSVVLLGDNFKPLRTNNHGTMHANSLLNGVPPDTKVEVVVRQDTGAGQWLDALSGTVQRIRL